MESNSSGIAIIWKPITTGMQTWIRDDYGAHTFSDNLFQLSTMAVSCQENYEGFEHWQNP